jgi:hypothetical protein
MAKQMFSKQVDLDPNQFGGIIDAEGMGVFLKKEGKNLYFVHAGHNYPGATSLIMASPVTGKGAVIMTNSAKGDLLQLEILTAVSNVYNWKAE